MLNALHLTNVGPAAEMRLQLAPRLNVITGDNGLGKTFLLDVAWWALTRSWAQAPALPAAGTEAATIEYRYRDREGLDAAHAGFDPAQQKWTFRKGARHLGLALYARADGGFSVFDPIREAAGKDGACHFDARQIWDGLEVDDQVRSNGLIRDWVSWQRESSPAFAQLVAALAGLSPSEDERLTPGPPRRISLDDARDIPTLRLPYGQDVPVIHASAGMRRVLQLTYLLVWAWNEHRTNAELTKQHATSQLTLLVDEVENHLHPRWQRVLLPALQQVVRMLIGDSSTNVQIIASTHAPLVMASLETSFDEKKDAWFDLDLVPGDGASATVSLERRNFIRQGDVSRWLTSDAFDLKSARSREAESAIDEAKAVLRAYDTVKTGEVKRVDKLLRGVLGELDPFWVAWGAFLDDRKRSR